MTRSTKILLALTVLTVGLYMFLAGRAVERYQYEDSLKRLRDEFSIRYTGRIEGRVEGKVESLLSLIEPRFEQTSEVIEKKIRTITDEEVLLAIQKLALQASTLQELEKAIKPLV